MGLGAVFLALVPAAKKWSPCGTERLELPEEETPEDGGGDEEMNTESRTSTSSNDNQHLHLRTNCDGQLRQQHDIRACDGHELPRARRKRRRRRKRNS
ncbi:hypothetical protein CRUP_015085 [Coryphaenoides rupestris]|nr:hypothetical protein CRUP_015085 [Coryphaenoides rupestris]